MGQQGPGEEGQVSDDEYRCSSGCIHPDYKPGLNRAGRRHYFDGNNKKHNTTRGLKFADALREDYRLRRLNDLQARRAKPIEPGDIPTSGPERRRAKAERNRIANSPQFRKVMSRSDREFFASAFGSLSPIEPVPVDVPNEGHPFFQERDPRTWEYPVC